MSFNKFANNLYKKACQDVAGNFVLGPGSIYSALALVMAGANGKTREEILRVIGLPDEDFNEHCEKTITGLMGGAGSAQLLSSNRVYADKGAPLLESYLKAIEKHYSADAVNVDFKHEPEAQRESINAWVADKTMDKIQNLLPSGSVHGDTSAVLVNAMYFRGYWNMFFQKSQTKPGNFTLLSSEKKEVDFMYKRETLGYFDSKSHTFRAIKMAFRDSGLTFGIILPNEVNGLTEILQGDHVLDIFEEKNFKSCEVDVALPKFKVTGEATLKRVLSSLGIESAFSVQADFSEMTNKPVFFSEGYHKAFIEVNEEGAEAAAATAMVMRLGCCPGAREPPPRFTVDRPFLFAILAKNDLPIFLGHVKDPSQ